MDTASIIKSRITIPEYFSRYIDHNIDLTEPTVINGIRYRAGLICCPFHKEQTPSFSYSAEKGVWRCFGKCHKGGDVISMHQVAMRLATREIAIESLANLLKIENNNFEYHETAITFNKKDAALRRLRTRASWLAKTVDDWIELDYIRTKFQRPEDEMDELDKFIKVLKLKKKEARML